MTLCSYASLRTFLMIVASGVLIIGVWPAPLLEVMDASVDRLLMHVAVSKL